MCVSPGGRVAALGRSCWSASLTRREWRPAFWAEQFPCGTSEEANRIWCFTKMNSLCPFRPVSPPPPMNGFLYAGPKQLQWTRWRSKPFSWLLFPQSHNRPASDWFWIRRLVFWFIYVFYLPRWKWKLQPFFKADRNSQNPLCNWDSGQHGGERV